MSSNSLIVDTNILFSILLREDSRLSKLLLNSTQTLYVCETVLVELFKHKERIVTLRGGWSLHFENVLTTYPSQIIKYIFQNT